MRMDCLPRVLNELQTRHRLCTHCAILMSTATWRHKIHAMQRLKIRRSCEREKKAQGNKNMQLKNGRHRETQKDTETEREKERVSVRKRDLYLQV